ncbi:MAG: hypothetical protein Q9219_002716 [cf. Caloplaca sp. 3 TL-2023]
MAVTALQSSNLQSPEATVGTDEMDMDMDMDIDLGPVDIPATAANDAISIQSPSHEAQLSNVIDCPDGEAVPHKIHIRGVDDLTTDDLKVFASEHHPKDIPSCVDWIDDTSANFVYNTPAAATEALKSFSLLPLDQQSTSTPMFLQLRPAKSVPNRPEYRLQVRIAVSTDVKKPRAYEASRFYMMHPEYDPREKARWRGSSGDRSVYRRRPDGDDGSRQRQRRERGKVYRADALKNNTDIPLSSRFTSRRGSASLSPDDASAVDVRNGRRSRHSACRNGDSYRPDLRFERSSPRTRSASPDKGHGYYVATDGQRPRRRTPPRHPKKELFPSLSFTTGSPSLSKELFPNKSIATSLKKELFPLKASSAHHRQSDAFDAAEETADLLATRMAFPTGDAPVHATSPAAVHSSYGRLRNSDSEPQFDGHDASAGAGQRIRRNSTHQDTGISILGAAKTMYTGTIRELFPHKAGNSGKELFAEPLQGRNQRRNKAEDLFY